MTELGTIPESARERMYARQWCLRRWRELQVRNRASAGRAATWVVQEAAVKHPGLKVSRRSLFTWAKRERTGEALADRYKPRGPDGNGTARSPEAVECFYSFYHDERRHSVQYCHDVALSESRVHGWH